MSSWHVATPAPAQLLYHREQPPSPQWQPLAPAQPVLLPTFAAPSAAYRHEEVLQPFDATTPHSLSPQSDGQASPAKPCHGVGNLRFRPLTLSTPHILPLHFRPPTFSTPYDFDPLRFRPPGPTGSTPLLWPPAGFRGCRAFTVLGFSGLRVLGL